ncbi:hypothetical protein OG21DRAFT_1509392 [Imleria badia]|nr:hypothetical protein OG21DRAFT_1509392 [Imleria badia]
MSSSAAPASSPGSIVAQPSSASTPPTQSSTGNAPTTSSATSPTPTTHESSPVQTTSAAPETTPTAAGSTNPASVAATTASTITSTSAFTSQVATTFSSTDPAGSVVYVTSTVPEIFTTSITSTTGGSHSSSNTGVIVGAVVGGVVGIIVIVLLLFCIRKRVRNDEFDGDFDPDRIVGHNGSGGGTLPHVDLADEVTPFPRPQSFTDQSSSSMRQYGRSPYVPVSPSLGPSGRASTEFYPHGGTDASTDTQHRPFMQPGAGQPPPGAYNMYGTGPVDWHNPRPGVSPPPSTVSNTTSSTRATKEREAMARGERGAGLGLATQHEAPEGSGDVVVHQDAGRAPVEEHTPPTEIPPAYESIRD